MSAWILMFTLINPLVSDLYQNIKGPRRARRFPNSDLLRIFLVKAKSLKVLSQALPYEEVDDTRSN